MKSRRKVRATKSKKQDAGVSKLPRMEVRLRSEAAWDDRLAALSPEARARAEDLERRLQGSTRSTCSQCGAEGVIVVASGKPITPWCVPCRAIEMYRQEQEADARPVALAAPREPKPEKKRRRSVEVVVQWEGKTYTFRSRREARKTMRALLKVKRLPDELRAVIGRRAHRKEA